MKEDADGLNSIQQAMQDLESLEYALLDDRDFEAAQVYLDAAYQHLMDAQAEIEEAEDADPGW